MFARFVEFCQHRTNARIYQYDSAVMKNFCPNCGAAMDEGERAYDEEPPYPCRVCSDYDFATGRCKSDGGCEKDENTMGAMMDGEE